MTFTNSIRAFSEGPSTKWGQSNGYPYTMTWGTSTWGEGESIPLSVMKVISNSQPFSGVYQGSRVVHLLGIGSASVDSDLYRYYNKTWTAGSVSPTFEMSSEVLKNGGWTYVFPSLATDGESRDFASWTAGSSPDVTFSCQAAGSTSWSET